jgi:hypothetical protein
MQDSMQQPISLTKVALTKSNLLASPDFRPNREVARDISVGILAAQTFPFLCLHVIPLPSLLFGYLFYI